MFVCNSYSIFYCNSHKFEIDPVKMELDRNPMAIDWCDLFESVCVGEKWKKVYFMSAFVILNLFNWL